MDEYYSKNLASNIKRALRYNANQGLFNGGYAPLGYKIVDKRYVVDKKEAKIVKFIFEQYLKGFSYYDIIKMCNDRNYKTKRNSDFKKNSLYEILHNEKYIGTYVYNKGVKHNKHKLNKDVIKIENAFEPIIDKETFFKVQELTKQNQKSSASYKANEVYLLSGIMFCGNCGGRFTGQTTKRIKNKKTYKSQYYSCSNHNKISNCNSPRLNKNKLEKFIIKCLLDKILKGKTIDEIATNVQIEYNKLVNEDNNFVDDLKEKLNNINFKINNLMIALENGSSNIVLNRLNELELEKEDIEKRIKLNNTSNSIVTNEEIKQALAYDLNVLSSNNKQEIKNIIQKYIKKIIVENSTITIYYTFASDVQFLNMSSFAQEEPYIFKTIIVDVQLFVANKKRSRN